MKRKKEKGKGKSQFIHTRRRFMERHSINFSKRMRKEFVRKIRQHDGVKFVSKTSNQRSIFDIEHEGNIYRVVYDKKRKNIVTVLSKKMN